MRKVLFLVLFVLNSCSSLENENSSVTKFKRRNLNEYFVGTGIVSYFLPILPKWANYSLEGQCRRARSMRYLDYDKMKSSFDLSYEQLVQFQLLYNTRVWNSMNLSKLDFIPFKDAERFFYDVSDKVQANSGSFKHPRFNRLHVIWIDQILGDKKKISKLKKMMNSRSMVKGFPVFFSLCMARIDVELFLKQNGMDRGSYEVLSYEMLSPFFPSGDMGLSPEINVDEFFNKKKKIYFYGPYVPRGIVGKKMIFKKMKI